MRYRTRQSGRTSRTAAVIRGRNWSAACSVEPIDDGVGVHVEQWAHRLVVHGEDAPSLFQKQASVRREAGAAAVALDHRAPQSLLQPPDMLADRGLAQRERLGSAMEAAAVRDRDQAAQRHDVEGRWAITAR